MKNLLSKLLVFFQKSKVYGQRSSFTLLEILVVIGIISILVAMGFASYSTAQKKARDARRKADLKAIQNSMEQHYSVCGFTYPTSIASGIVCSSPATTIMATIPTDPKGGAYTSTLTATSFQFCATLESETPASYCVANSQ